MKKLALILFLFISISSLANRSSLTADYLSPDDELVNINNVLIMPTVDNIDGIYSRPIDKFLTDLIHKNHHWDLVKSNFTGSILTPRDLELSPKEVTRIGENTKADAILATQISKSPQGINLLLSLFITKDGKLIAQEKVLNFNHYELKDVSAELTKMINKIKRKIPYAGRVLSRTNKRVTVNLGKLDGAYKDQIVSVVQVIKLERHPKFNFIVGAEKEVLGKIKLLKIDDTISFGIILTEKEKGIIKDQAKVAGVSFQKYADVNPFEFNSNKSKELNNRPDALISFGEAPKEWIPVKPPTLGAAEINLGLGSFNNNVDLGSSTESAKKNIYPSLSIKGELWLTPVWTMEAGLSQGTLEVNNPSSTGPSTLNMSTAEYDLNIVYNFLFAGDFFGPKAQAIFGFSSYNRFIDSGSNLTGTKYSGATFGLRAKSPFGLRNVWNFGVEFFFYLSGALTESPSASGSNSTNTISKYGFFGERKITEKFYFTTALSFQSYSTSFGSGTAQSMSQRTSTANAGVKYLF